MSVDRLKIDLKQAKRIFIDQQPVKYVLMDDKYIFADPIDLTFCTSKFVSSGSTSFEIDETVSNVSTTQNSVKTHTIGYGARVESYLSKSVPTNIESVANKFIHNYTPLLSEYNDGEGGIEYILENNTRFDRRTFWASAQLLENRFPEGTYYSFDTTVSLPSTEYIIKASNQFVAQSNQSATIYTSDTLIIDSEGIRIGSDGWIYTSWDGWSSPSWGKYTKRILAQGTGYCEGTTSEAARWFNSNTTCVMTDSSSVKCTASRVLVSPDYYTGVFIDFSEGGSSCEFQVTIDGETKTFKELQYYKDQGTLVYRSSTETITVKPSHAEDFIHSGYRTLYLRNASSFKVNPWKARWFNANFA